MQELMQKHYEQLARATITQLRRRGFEAEWFATAEEAKAAALRLLPEGCTVAWGGSATIRDMGLTEAVHAGNWKVIDGIWQRPRRSGQSCTGRDCSPTGI